ncbi:MAG: mechanosensitive ion channel family protein [Myxococcales bacterium]|nr:mechanosensitive ion channel family protein [Myxococcales bacterium]
MFSKFCFCYRRLPVELVGKILAQAAPLLPGLITAGIFVATLIVLRVLFRREPFARKLRLPSVLFWLYLVLAVVTLVTTAYSPRGAKLLHGVSLAVLGLAIVLAGAVTIFDVLLGRYRKVEAPKIVRDIVVVVVFIIVILAVLSSQGVDLSSILTTSAVVTAILGLALQDLLSSVVAGIAIQIERPFTVGDWVKFSEQEGRVLEMNWRSTKIQTLHNDIVIIPNNVVTKSWMLNFTSPTSLHRRKISIGLRYEVPPAKAKAALLRAALSVEGVCRDPEPFVLLRKYDDFAITYRLHFFIVDFPNKDRIEDDVASRIWYQLSRDGLSVPFPIRDINVRQIDESSLRAEREAARAEVVSALEHVTFLEALNTKERERLADGIERARYTAGEKIIVQGDEGDSFYILAEGEVDVLVGGRRVAALSSGNYFGEMSLMTGETRSATIAATSDCLLYVVGKDAFKTIIESNGALVDKIGERLETRRSELRESAEHAATGTGDGKTSSASAGHEESLGSRIRRFFNLK